MANTRFMERMFAASDVNSREENLVMQVFSDIQKAKEGDAVDTEELKYEKLDGEDKVMITDKGNNETTIAEISEDGNVDLYNPEDAVVEESTQMDGFLHPEVEDEVIPGNQTNPVDTVEEHLEEGVISPNLECGGKNPEAGCEKTVEEHAEEGKEAECAEGECPEEKEDEQKEFSVYSDNTVVQKIFSQQEYCEMLFSEIIAEETEDVAKVGNLKIEKVDGDTLIVSDTKSGDQAKVLLTDDEMEVEELGSKNFSEEGEQPVESNEQLEPLHVVGVDAGNHQLVDTSVFDEEAANEIATRLADAGVDAVEIFEDEAAARDYAAELLGNLGVESEENIEEPTEATFSDVDGFECDVFVTKYYSNNTCFMDRLFSEASQGIETSQAKIEDALENGDEIETEEEIVTPISATEAVVKSKDNDGEYTKVTIDDDNMKLDAITEDEANDLMDDIAVSEDEVDEDEQAEDVVEDAEDDAEQAEEDKIEEEDKEKDFSDIYTNEAETKFFSENEPMTQYMIRLFSEEEKEELIEESIENGNQIENDDIKITPIDSETAIIEDKKNDGEITKAVMTEEDIDLSPISDEEAKDLMENITVSEEEEKVEEPKDKEEEVKEEDKKFSNTVLDKWFAEAVAPAAGINAQPVAQDAPTVEFIVDENGNPVAPVNAEEPAPSVEAIEDKAIAAVQQIQAAAAEAEAAILNAKAAPVEGQEGDLQEATFSEKENIEEKAFSGNDVLVSWLNGTQRN